ncbi:rhodanese-like domain-containing protein [Chlorobium sp.]|uniref:rhodanese-like domain-containing protein n=1 Tax=Chlorobium sp. TaxID=1095 RepID=UPI0025BB30B6|nr:rhodanese-like domain-containing protein [Chlorobium sp.]
MIKVKNVTPATAFAMTKKGALLVDVREPWEIARKAFDVPDIMVIPLGKLAQRLEEVPTDRNLIIVCNSGNRSETASRLFLNRGYRKVVNMEYGIIGWEKEGLPLKRKPEKNLVSLLVQLFRKQS